MLTQDATTLLDVAVVAIGEETGNEVAQAAGGARLMDVDGER